MERKGGLRVGGDGLIASDKSGNFAIAHVSPVLIVLLIQHQIDSYYTDSQIGTLVLFVHLLHNTNQPSISCIWIRGRYFIDYFNLTVKKVLVSFCELMMRCRLFPSLDIRSVGRSFLIDVARILTILRASRQHDLGIEPMNT